MNLRLLSALLLPLSCLSQGYTSYFTGNPDNVTTITTPGTCLMGGATEHDNAMIWLLQRANGGDVVVLRSSGSNGYNNYLYSELGVNVNSVETLVITSAAGATDPYVLNKVANAEMIWFAGGDQWNYVSYFKNNPLEDLLNAHINIKHAPIGGTSAGMAILGSEYYSAQNGSVTSAQALNNPYHPNVTIGVQDFLQVPYLFNVITDTHYDNPDRRGRHAAFIARLIEDLGFQTRGIACNEYVAVCIDENGIARVFGDYPSYEEFAYFLMPNCESGYIENGIEICEPNTPLTWNYSGGGIKVYKVPGTMTGENYLDLSQWPDGVGSGGMWEHWNIVNGSLNVSNGTPVQQCMLGVNETTPTSAIALPNPFNDFIIIDAEEASVEIFDAAGRPIYYNASVQGKTVETSGFSSGVYIVKIVTPERPQIIKMIKK